MWVGVMGVQSGHKAGPDHRTHESHVRVLDSILKVRDGPKDIFKMGHVGDSIEGVISSLGWWC